MNSHTIICTIELSELETPKTKTPGCLTFRKIEGVCTVSRRENQKGNNNIEQLYEEFGSSMAANCIVQGPGETIDLRGQLLTGCVQCGKRIAEFMLPQDIACALTVGEFEFNGATADKLLKKIVDNGISLADAAAQADGLVRAAGETAIVLRNLKETNIEMFLQVLAILWKHGKES